MTFDGPILVGNENHTLFVLGASAAEVELVAAAVRALDSTEAALQAEALGEIARINGDVLQAVDAGPDETAPIPARRLDPQVLPDVARQAERALAQVRGNGPLAVLSGRELARTAPFWTAVAQQLGTAAAVLVASDPPALTQPSESGHLDWLAQTLLAERATRAMPRKVLRPAALHADWLVTLAEVGAACAFAPGDELERAAPRIEALLDACPPAKAGRISGAWLRDCHAALAILAERGADEAALATLDRVHAEFTRARGLFLPSLADLQRQVRALAGERDDALAEEAARTERLARLEIERLDLQAAGAVARRDRAALAEALREREDEAADLGAELAAARARAETAAARAEAAGARAARDAAAFVGEIEEQARRANALAAEVAELQAQLAEVSSAATAPAPVPLPVDDGEKQALRHQIDQLTAQAAAERARALDERLTAGRKAVALNEVEQALLRHTERQLAEARKPIGKLARKFKLGYRRAARIERQAAMIGRFLDDLPWPLIGVPPEGRKRRIIAYLAGITDHLADFPLVRNSEYAAMYPDVADSGMPALVHFIAHGQAEGRNPHPLFDTSWYTWRHPEAAHLAPSPVVHYLKWGMQKGFDPHPLFSTNDYRKRYADVGASGRNPLVHWLDAFRCTATVLFDADFYLTAYPDVAEAGRNPLAHYLTLGWREGRNPHPLFDTGYYLAQLPGLAAQGVCPLVHYAQDGWRERRRPSAAFDPAWYLASYPDLGADVDPLRHYIEHGRAEGRLPRDLSAPVAVEPLALAPAPAPVSRVAPPAPAPRPIVPASGKRVALMIDAFWPRPDRDSGSMDQMSFVRIFQRLGYEVHYLAVLDFGQDHDHESERYRQELQAGGVRCVTCADHPFPESYYFAEGDRIDVVFGSRVHFGGMQLEVIRQLCPNARTIFNTVDLHFVREEREGQLKGDSLLVAHAARTRALECRICEEADATVVVSTVDKQTLADHAPEARTLVVPLIRDFATPSANTFAQRNGLAFIGGFKHQPNIDAVNHFLAEFWPELHRRRGDLTLRIIGADMPEAMQRQRVPGVEFTGFVTDLDAELAQLRLTIAPLRFGAGAKGKLVSSLGAGVPCVVSTVAAEGMGLVDGESVLVAELGAGFGAAIERLHDDEALWNRLSANGRAFIHREYSLDTGFDLMRGLLTDLGLRLPQS